MTNPDEPKRSIDAVKAVGRSLQEFKDPTNWVTDPDVLRRPSRSQWRVTAPASDTRTMTLTEFLLARIADDVAEVRDWPEEGQWGRFDETRMWTDPHERPIYAPRARVLAECEAKRRIIRGHWLTPEPYVLRCLALPYANHPDYREEWRP